MKAGKSNQAAQIMQLKQEIKAKDRKIAELIKDVEGAQKYADAARKANQKRTIRTNPRKKPRKEDWTRLIVPDVHGDSRDKEACAAMFDVVKSLTIDEIVIMGDLVDCGGFLAEHHTMGFIKETGYTYEGDLAEANAFLDELLNVCGNVQKVHYLEGNHEHRLEVWAVDKAKNPTDAAWLYNQVSPVRTLDLDRRGIKFYKSDSTHNSNVLGIMHLDGTYFMHGKGCAKHAAYNHAVAIGADAWYAHTHRRDSCTCRNVISGDFEVNNPGTLSILSPLYGHQHVNTWAHGFGLEFISRKGMKDRKSVWIKEGVAQLASIYKGGK